MLPCPLKWDNLSAFTIETIFDIITFCSTGIIETMSVIRVLSTDDVAFRLNGNGNETSSPEVVQSASGEWPSICVTLTNTSGLLFISFLCIIVVSVITSTVIGCRRRNSVKKVKASKMTMPTSTTTLTSSTSTKDLKLSSSASASTSYISPIPQKPPIYDGSSKKLKK